MLYGINNKGIADSLDVNKPQNSMNSMNIRDMIQSRKNLHSMSMENINRRNLAPGSTDMASANITNSYGQFIPN